MTVGKHVLEVVRRGIWSNLTGGWYYEPANSIFCNTVHFYVWSLFFIFPLLIGIMLNSGGSHLLPLLATYIGFVIFISALVKAIVAQLHRILDFSKPVYSDILNLANLYYT